MSRALPVFLISAALAACSPRAKDGETAPTPMPGTTWPTVDNPDGRLETRGGAGTVYRDAPGRFELDLPPAFTGRTRFVADASGPPAEGRVRLRLTDTGEPACVIDVALAEPIDPAAIESSIAVGREVFFLAEVGPAAAPEMAADAVWAATLVPVEANRTDMGYWVFADGRIVRVEGRFPVARLSACKEALDAIVASLRPLESGLSRGSAGSRSRAPQRRP